MFRSIRDLIQNVPLDDEETAIEEIAQRVVREGMGTAAIVFLESTKPISFLTGQAAIFATPIIGGFIEPLRLERYANLFSDRSFIERLIRRIEELESDRAGAKTDKGEPKDNK
ncbi:MAG TPA: hypothetical protein VHV83_17200 [Armatimonadota bacterium]|nr:hypothetical protein [Armatimonadota bacterium]